MATYTATVTLDTPTANKMDGTPLRILTGTVNLNPYSQVRAGFAIAGIVGEFSNGVPRCFASAGDSGFIAQWDMVTQNFKVYDTGASSGAALAEAAEGANCGNFSFIAVGV